MNLRSLGAIVAGLAFTVIVSTVVDGLLHGLGFFPSLDQPIDNLQSLVATTYRFAISVGGAWLTAWLAPAHPLQHAIILGYFGAALGFIGVVLTWNAGMGPRWYPIALAVLAIPQCWLGGWIYQSRNPGVR
jgi:hypothetical protein